ncbi:MAG: dCTP deaminase, partial [Pyrobaculum sp.]
LTTEEYVKMPDDVVGLANLRSTLARYGLVIPPTVVDAGFEGNITIEVVNESPNTIVLKRGMRFLHLILVKAEGRALYQGAYQGQRGVRPPKGLRAECH